MFFSLFLFSNNFDLLKINLFNDGHEHNLSIDTLQIEKANAFDDDDDNLDLKNTTLQNTGLSTTTTTTTKSSNNIGGFNFVAAGDWACTSKAKDTVKNIIDHDAELILALGDLSYDSSAKCWLKIIKPIAEKTKIVIGNHEANSSKKLKDYMEAFDLEKQYYSLNYQNVHFLALSTETSYDEGSKQ
jgi:hypothetical protein